jgi:hypothetical protein
MEANLSYPQPTEVVPLRDGIPSDVTQTEPSGAGEKAIASPEEALSGLYLVSPPILARLNAPSEVEKSKIIVYYPRQTPRPSLCPT